PCARRHRFRRRSCDTTWLGREAVMNRPLVLLALGCLPVLAAFAAWEGGWAAITVEDLPDYVIAQKPTTLAFTVRQHGVTPLDGLGASVEARAGDQEVHATAVPAQTRGQYTATFTLPRADNWHITVKSGFGASNVNLVP